MEVASSRKHPAKLKRKNLEICGSRVSVKVLGKAIKTITSTLDIN